MENNLLGSLFQKQIIQNSLLGSLFIKKNNLFETTYLGKTAFSKTAYSKQLI